jgi:hypothetical protein
MASLETVCKSDRGSPTIRGAKPTTVSLRLELGNAGHSSKRGYWQERHVSGTGPFSAMFSCE